MNPLRQLSIPTKLLCAVFHPLQPLLTHLAFVGGQPILVAQFFQFAGSRTFISKHGSK